jgi:hypothetical protein
MTKARARKPGLREGREVSYEWRIDATVPIDGNDAGHDGGRRVGRYGCGVVVVVSRLKCQYVWWRQA